MPPAPGRAEAPLTGSDRLFNVETGPKSIESPCAVAWPENSTLGGLPGLHVLNHCQVFRDRTLHPIRNRDKFKYMRTAFRP